MHGNLTSEACFGSETTDWQWPLHVGVSIGIALGTNDQDFQVLMRHADAAMYDAKRSRSGYEFWRGEAMAHAGAQPISKAV